MSLLQMSLSGAVMILAVVVIRALAINTFPKRTFLALWAVVLLRLLVPYSLPSVFSVYSLTDNLAPASEGAAVLPVEYFAAEPVQGAVSASSAGGSIDTWALIWLAGAALMLLFFAAAYVKCFREFKTSLPVDEHLIENWRRSGRLRRPVEIRQSDRISVPLTYGVFRPVILLPKDFPWADRNTVKYVLAHEYIHIRRFDPTAKLVLAAALCVHWFNPLVWCMYFLANRDIELSCDEAVVRLFGIKNRAAYARTLVNMRGPRNALNPLYSGFNKSAIEERIVAIMKIKKKTVLSVILAVAVVAGTTAAFATTAKEDTPMTPLADDTTISAPADRDNTVTPPDTDKTNDVQPPVELKENGQAKPAEELTAPDSGSAPAPAPVPDTGKKPEQPQPSEKPEPDDGSGVVVGGRTVYYSRLEKTASFLTPEERDNYDKRLEELKEQYVKDESSYINSSGQVVGVPGLSLVTDRKPDLVGCIGKSGVKGYCKADDLNGPKVNNPKEAMEYMANRKEDKIIPVYDFEGNQIDTFVIPALSKSEVEAAQKALDEMIANHMYED